MGQDHSPAAALPALPAHPGAFFYKGFRKAFLWMPFHIFYKGKQERKHSFWGSPPNVFLLRRNDLAQITAVTLHSFGHGVVNVF